SDTSKSDAEIMDTWWQLLTETGYDPSSNEVLLFGNESVSDQTRLQTNGKEPSQTTQNFGSFTYPSSTSLTTATNDWISGTISSIPSPEKALSNLNATCEKLWTYGETSELISGQSLHNTKWQNSYDVPQQWDGTTLHHSRPSHHNHLTTPDRIHLPMRTWTNMWTTREEMSNPSH